jgi:prepilin-type N-terminal cleavage/methylation domain-containing protein
VIPTFPRTKVSAIFGHRTQLGDRNGFTLVEILVALTVLSLIVLVIAQIFSASSTAISQNSKTINALDASESVLQQIGLDISRMVLRNDVDYGFVKNALGTAGNLPGNDQLSFYARTTGFSSTTQAPSTGTLRPLSVVGYQVVQNSTTHLLELDYGALQVGWDDTGNNPPGSSPFTLTSATQLLTTPTAPLNTLPLIPSSGTASLFTTLAPEVIRMEICFVLNNDPVTTDASPKLLTPTPPVYVPYTSATQNPAAVPYPIQNVAGIIVGIVVIDPKSRLLLPSGVDLKVAQLFPDAVANQDLLSLWTPKNTISQLKANGVPATAAAGVRIYQKYFPLPW